MLQLKSNFTDYYDHQFDLEGPIWNRDSTKGYSKQKQFEMLAKAGYAIPPIGRAQDLFYKYYNEEPDNLTREDFGYRIRNVIAYTDPNAHCGDGKELWCKTHCNYGNFMGGEAHEKQEQKRNTFASAYVMKKSIAENGVSFRHLQVGKHVFWLRYWSDEDWRSNCGEGGCKLINYSLFEGYHRTFKLPLFAIDFVEGRSGTMYAIDFNNAPGIRGSGVERVLSPILAAEAIKQAIIKFEDYNA